MSKPKMDYGIMKEKLDALNRKKDLVCLILSYPMKNVNKGRHKRWIQEILSNQKLGDVEMLTSEIYHEINRLLDHSIADIEAYVPHELFEKMCKRTPEAEPTPTVHKEILDMAVGFATDQIFENMKNPHIKRIGISGRDRERVMSGLNRRQETRTMFKVVIYIDASLYSSVTDIEDGIALKLGMSASTAPEFPEFMKSLDFLILLRDVKRTIELNKLGTNWWNLNKLQAIVSTTTFQGAYRRMAIDLEVRVEDHLLSWELFCMNIGKDLHSSSIQPQVVIDVVKACWRHLLAIVLMARALKDVEDVEVWKDASVRVVRQTPTQVEDKVLFNALAFIWKHSVSAQKFLEYCALSMEKEGMDKVGLIHRWIADTLIGTVDEGEKIVGDLLNAFLLESWQNGKLVRMRDEIREVLLKMLKSERELPAIVHLGGRGLTKPPRDEAWKAAQRLDLGDNELSELPDKPNCPHLKDLSLQTNPYLRKIPPSFFELMPALHTLNLSYTRINTLPPSIFQLGQLQDFVLRGCELMIQLPPEVGELKNLEVLDLEGTEILELPAEVGNLKKLKNLAVSFYADDQYERNGKSNTMVPQNVISNLVQLKELSMDVNPDDERWNTTVKHIVEEVCRLEQLKALKLYLPEVALLEEFNERGTSSSTYLSLLQFRFIVGSHLKRIISRSPRESAFKFEQQGRHLKYVNGENVPDNFKKALQHATALFIDRHSTVTSLSEFGTENMKKLEFCMLGECHEIRTIIAAETSNRGGKEDAVEGTVLESLSHLCIYSMKSLRSIQEGSISMVCFSNLKSLALHTCPQLKTLFNYALLKNLNMLEELMVEDCPEIVSLVDENFPFPNFEWYLPSLKRISLHYMPKLDSISRGFKIAPKLEWMTFYGCWNLETFPSNEVSVTDLKVIIGDADWWRALKLNTSKRGISWPSNLDSIFVPVDRNRDLTTQISDIVTQHKATRQDTWPPQQPDSRTISKGNQLYHSASSPPLSPDSHRDDAIKGMDEVFCSMEEMPESLHNVVEDVVSFLEDKQTRRVGIWGTMGTGKTTIMQNLKNHKDIVKMFDIVIWVTLPKEWSIKKLQDAILQQLEKIVQSNVSVKETARRIFEMLRGKKYLILLDEVCGFVDLHKIMQIQDNQESKVVSASRFRDICKAMGADELIKVKPLSDHEAFSLFEEKVGQSIHFPRIREVAKDVIKECGGLPLVIDKVAREFKKKGKNVSLWRDGLRHLQKWEAECIHEAISFMKSCYDKVDDDKKKAFLYCVLFPEEYDVYIDYLLECWRAEGFIRSRDQGHQILNTLINLSLLEMSEKRAYYVKLSKMVRGLAIMISSQTTDSRFLLKPHHGLKEPPQGQEWKQASRISLIDNHLASLPENLDCGNLLTLFLQGNKKLLSIPKLFFSSMHCLQVLDLHGTGISSLPSSVSDLISLKALYLNSCINLEELPSSIKGLHYLEVLDIRGTKLYLFQMKVPLWLKCLRISVFNLCAQTTTRRELDSISALVSLEEFCVDDDCPKQGWDEVAKNLILEVAALQNLTSFRFYFPTVNTLKLFLTKSPAWKRTSAFTFQFSVGLQKPTYSELPEYFNAPSYNHLKLANTNASDFVILELLMRTHVLSLIDHQGVSTLSDFSVENLDTLLACTVEGCKEIETIINGDGTKRGTALQCLEYLCIHNLSKLEIIWKGPVLARSLHQLKILILTKCPKLKKIFSNGMIQQLHHLQQLTVQECHEIEEIVTESENHGLDPGSLPRLKSLVLLDLPQLRSIWVDDSLEWPSLQNIRIFRCNKLKRLPFGRANAARLRSIEGEESWWETLVWQDDAIKERLQSICTRSVSL